MNISTIKYTGDEGNVFPYSYDTACNPIDGKIEGIIANSGFLKNEQVIELRKDSDGRPVLNSETYACRLDTPTKKGAVLIAEGTFKRAKNGLLFSKQDKTLKNCVVLIGKRYQFCTDQDWARLSALYTHEKEMMLRVMAMEIPHTVTLLGYYHKETFGRKWGDQKHYFIVEKCDENLTSFMEKLSGFEPSKKRKIQIKFSCQLAETLSKINDKGLIHRDVKGDNVLITGASGELDLMKIVLTDFGAMCAKDERERHTDFVSTCPPPEVAKAEENFAIPPELTTDKIDSWGLGSVLYQLWHPRVQLLFSGGGNWTQMRDIANSPEDCTMQVQLAQITDSSYRRVIGGLLDFNPETRWTTQKAYEELKVLS